MERCQYCNHLELRGYEAFVLHLQQFHSYAPNLIFKCNRQGCPKSFSNFSSRRAHISKSHRQAEHNGQPAILNDVELRVNVEPPEDEFNIPPVNQNYQPLQENCTQAQKEAEALFLLNLRSRNVTDSVVKIIIENSESLVSACLENFKQKVENALTRNGLILGNYLDVAQAQKQCCEVFTDVKTKWKQNSLYKDTMGVTLPQRIQLNHRIVRDRVGNIMNNRRAAVHADTLMYVPIIEVISKLMAHPDYPKIIMNNAISEDGYMRTFRDGTYFSTNRLFQQHPNALPLILYYDDVNLVDTASSRPVSMSYFYFTLGNIHPRFRSKLDFIFLVMAVETDAMKACSINEILEPLVNDIKKFEQGLDINGEMVYGTIVAFVGDNLALHKIGGFKEGFTATHSCRYCMVTLHQLRRMTREDASILRTSDQYNEQIEQLNNAEDDDVFRALSENFGINRATLINDFHFFDVIGGLMPDLFHDHLYAQLGNHCQFLLRHFLIGRFKVMTLTDFNDALMEHDFGYTETIPSKILEGHLRASGNFHQTGAQSWSLAFCVTLILGPKVDYFDEYWLNFLDLLQISEMIMCHEISRGLTDQLVFLIDKYYSEFLRLYENAHLVPRQHYLIHYPRLMEVMGPLYQFITFRFEAKHQYFKDMMKKFKCVKNPALTTANQHQLKQSYLWSGPLVKGEEQGPVKRRSRLEVTYSESLPLDMNVVHTVAWVTIYGVTYRPLKCYVLLDCNDGIPHFGFLTEIIYINDKPVFVCTQVPTIEKCLHLNAFEIGLQGTTKLVDYSELYIYSVFHAHIVNDKYYISIKRSFRNLL